MAASSSALTSPRPLPANSLVEFIYFITLAAGRAYKRRFNFFLRVNGDRLPPMFTFQEKHAQTRRCQPRPDEGNGPLASLILVNEPLLCR